MTFWILLSCLLIILIGVAVLLFLAVAVGKFFDGLVEDE